MPRYRMSVEITSASGARWYTVVAASAEEAIEKCKAGEATFEHDEIDANELEYPEVEDVEEID